MNKFIKLYWIVFFAIVLTACQKWNIEPNEVQDVKTDGKVTKEPVEDTVEELNIVDLDINEIVSEEVIDESENSDGEKIPQIRKIELKSKDYVAQLPDIIRDKRDGKYYIVLRTIDESNIKAGRRFIDKDWVKSLKNLTLEEYIENFTNNVHFLNAKLWNYLLYKSNLRTVEFPGHINTAKKKATVGTYKLAGGSTEKTYDISVETTESNSRLNLSLNNPKGITIGVRLLGENGDWLDLMTLKKNDAISLRDPIYIDDNAKKTIINDKNAKARIKIYGSININPSFDLKYSYFGPKDDIIIEDFNEWINILNIPEEVYKDIILYVPEKLRTIASLKELLFIYYQDLIYDLNVELNFEKEFTKEWKIQAHPKVTIVIPMTPPFPTINISVNSNLILNYEVSGNIDLKYHYKKSNYLIKGMRIARDTTKPFSENDIEYISEEYNENTEKLEIVARVKIGAGIYLETTLGVKLVESHGPGVSFTLKGGLKASANVQVSATTQSTPNVDYDNDFEAKVYLSVTGNLDLSFWGILKNSKYSHTFIDIEKTIIKLPTELKPENVVIKLPTESGDSFDEINNTSLELNTEYTIPLKLKGLLFKVEIDSFIPTLVYFTDGDEKNNQVFLSDTSGNVEVKYTPKTIGNKTLRFIVNDGAGNERLRKEVEVTVVDNVNVSQISPPTQNLKPTLSLPNNGVNAFLSKNGTVQLTWTAPSFTEIHTISYNILYSNSPTATDFTTLATNITGLTYDATGLTADNTYFWKVVSNFKEENQNLKYTGTSEKFSFTVKAAVVVPPINSDTIYFKFRKEDNDFILDDAGVSATIDRKRKIIWYHLEKGITAEKLSNLTPTVSNELTKKVKEGDGELTDFLAPQTYTLTTGGVTEDYQVQVQAKKDRSDLRLILVEALKTTNKGSTANLNFIDTSKIIDMSGVLSNSSFNGNVSLWDVSNVTNMKSMFAGASSFNGDISSWNVSKVEDMASMFSNASKFNSEMYSWNVSAVKDMSNMFFSASNFDSNISSWNVSAVKDMSSMFSSASNFDTDLSKWNVSKVENMFNMFHSANNFTSNLSEWNVSAVKNMSSMFSTLYYSSGFVGGRYPHTSSSEFTSDLSGWNVSNVEYMSNMFYGASSFNGDITTWNVSNVKNMSNMFKQAGIFDKDLSSWNVSKVTDMSYMFYRASEFTSDLSKWNVSSVTDMGEMFHLAGKFTSDLSSWNVSKVTDMFGMFKDASKFTSDLSSWDVSKVTSHTHMFSGATLMTVAKQPTFN